MGEWFEGSGTVVRVEGVLGFLLDAYEWNFSHPRESDERAGEDRPCGRACRKEAGGDFVDRRFENASGGGDSRGLRGRVAALWGESSAGVGRQVAAARRFAGHVAFDWSLAEQ